MEKKKILITAGGTATAWHIVQIIKTYYDDVFEIHICDINPPELIAASLYSYKYHQVPYIVDANYDKVILHILQEEEIDYVIPLIDFDLKFFAENAQFLKQLGVISTGPAYDTFQILSHKGKLHDFLKSINVPTLNIYNVKDIHPDVNYVLKPSIGFGSKGIRIVEGAKVSSLLNNDDIIQELSVMGEGVFEITAEVYNYNNCLRVFCRQRIETKDGVCTKTKIIHNSQIEDSIKTLVSNIPCPIAFCVQFLYRGATWCVSDCNLRLGAGTAFASKAGFQLTRALIATMLDKKEHAELLIPDNSIKSMLRVYNEVVIR